MNNHRLTIDELIGDSHKSKGYKKRRLFFGKDITHNPQEKTSERLKRVEIFTALEKAGVEIKEAQLRRELDSIGVENPILQYFVAGATIMQTAEYFQVTKTYIKQLIKDKLDSRRKKQ